MEEIKKKNKPLRKFLKIVSIILICIILLYTIFRVVLLSYYVYHNFDHIKDLIKFRYDPDTGKPGDVYQVGEFLPYPLRHAVVKGEVPDFLHTNRYWFTSEAYEHRLFGSVYVYRPVKSLDVLNNGDKFRLKGIDIMYKDGEIIYRYNAYDTVSDYTERYKYVMLDAGGNIMGIHYGENRTNDKRTAEEIPEMAESIAKKYVDDISEYTLKIHVIDSLNLPPTTLYSYAKYNGNIMLEDYVNVYFREDLGWGVDSVYMNFDDRRKAPEIDAEETYEYVCAKVKEQMTLDHEIIYCELHKDPDGNLYVWCAVQYPYMEDHPPATTFFAVYLE
ncbi:MAG: hypothetical protein IJY04_04290 [Clostridia bacterium]|nr:hypothetical protein [Clostridia bacterium]